MEYELDRQPDASDTDLDEDDEYITSIQSHPLNGWHGDETLLEKYGMSGEEIEHQKNQLGFMFFLSFFLMFEFMPFFPLIFVLIFFSHV